MSQKNFYRAFEDRYRGSRELILGRFKVYLDFLTPLKGLFKNASAIDLGCGRGEFLEVLLSAGFKAKGVDLDAGMLQACTELKLPAEKGDALAFLAKLPKQSQVVVSAFHVVEHIPFEQLQTLVAEAYRVLKPGGILILETPNPENITVATANFYLDPTHQRPIPPLLLSFVGEYAGFERVKVLRLQELPTLREKQNVDLADVLSGVSPDYSIVAQKAGSEKATAALHSAFTKDYGLSANELAARYENFHQRSIEQLGQADLETKSEIGAVHEMIKSEAAEVRTKLEQAAGELGAARAEKEALVAEQEKTEAELAEARTKLEQAAGELGAVRAVKEALAAEREKAGAELAEAHARLERMVGELGAAGAEKEALRVEIEHQTNLVQNLSSERNALKNEIGTSALSLQQAQKSLEDTKQELHQIHQANHHHHLLAQERQHQIDDLLQSTCWRITAPLRWCRRLFAGKTHRNTEESLANTLLTHSALYIRRRPYLKQRALGLLLRYPALHSRVLPVLRKIHSAGNPTDHASGTSFELSANGVTSKESIKQIDDLTPHARRIYEQLKSLQGRIH
jgi:SAM-dependent methyltransferase